MKLNLASGSDYRIGWVNADVVSWPGYREPDVYWDARKDPVPCGDGEATDIYMGYTFMHLAPRYHRPLALEVYRALSRTGQLIVTEVDMTAVMPRWLENPFETGVSQLIWGEQGIIHGVELSDFDKHCWGFTEQTLRYVLGDVGFAHIKRLPLLNPAIWWDMHFIMEK